MMRLMISVIIVLLSVYGSNAETVLGAACTTEGAQTPTALGCEFYHLCESLVIVNRRCPAGETFNIELIMCSTTPSCTTTTMAPTAPIIVPTAPTGTGGSFDTTVPISETTVPASETTVPAAETTVPAAETTPPASGTTTPPANVPTVPTVTPPPATPPPQTTQTTAPGTPTTQPTPPGGSLWPTGPITCTVAGPVYYGHHIRCDQFQICSNGQIFLRTCPTGQHWAPTLTRCDWPNVARCPHLM